MNIKRLVLDVDKALARPSVLEIADVLSKCPGVEDLNITVTEIDAQTVGMDVTIEGQQLDYERVVESIESTGAVVHSVDQVACGQRIIERVVRAR